MNFERLKALPYFLKILGLDEQPMSIFYTDKKPIAGFSPKPLDLPTREKEIKNEINWQAIFDQCSCAIGNIWRARKKKTAAYFSEECFGCPGGAFWLGFMKPQTETIIRYVSTGIPGRMEGELYCDSPEVLRQIFEQIDPTPAPKKFCVVKLHHPTWGSARCSSISPLFPVTRAQPSPEPMVNFRDWTIVLRYPKIVHPAPDILSRLVKGTPLRVA